MKHQERAWTSPIRSLLMAASRWMTSITLTGKGGMAGAAGSLLQAPSNRAEKMAEIRAKYDGRMMGIR